MAEMDDGSPSRALMTLAERLDRLFRAVLRPDGRQYSNADVERGIRDAAGPGGTTVSSSQIQQLRSGGQTNPTLKTLSALGAFFDVPLAYFADDEVTERVAWEKKLAATMRDTGVHRLALRAQDLPAESVQAMIGMLDQARRIAKLPPIEEPSDLAMPPDSH